MEAHTKSLILASCLTLAAMPLLYVGGQNGSATLITIGFVIFCAGMGMAPILYLRKKAEAAKYSTPTDRKTAS